MACFEAFNSMCQKIVRPVRHSLNEDEMIERRFKSKSICYETLEIKNSQQDKLSVIVFQRSFRLYPTILYLHGNGGHKLQSLQIAFEQLNLIAFDFCGCGKSEGEYLTYGEKEVEDIRAVVEEIAKKYNIKKLTLWGRSMGSSLAMMYTAKYPRQIHCLILDTPFRYLKKVVFNVAQQSSKLVPNFIISIVLFLVQKRTESIVGSNIFETDFSKSLQKISVPIMFAYSTKDTVVRQNDVKELYNLYQGEKCMNKIESLHHQDRPKSFIEAGFKFIVQSLHSLQKEVHSLKYSKYSYSQKSFAQDVYQ